MYDHVFSEYENLNHTLDQLESCLDILEQQNDSLFAKLQELLEEGNQVCFNNFNFMVTIK